MTVSLQNLLRHELNAVNQQFIHILALKAWGENEMADRITQVDNIDFPNAMRIIDHLVATGARMDLEPSGFSPGQSPAGIPAAEREIERRLSRAIGDIDAAGEREAVLLGAAREPRHAYLEWLDEHIDETAAGASEPPRDAAETAATVAHLVTLMELSMVHAFVHWHRGDEAAADAAWATSGASMMLLTRLVRAFAAVPGVPFPGECPPLPVQRDSKAALQSEQRLASLCEREALSASQRCSEKSVTGVCRLVAGFCSAFANWDSATPHPAASTNPACFHSFEATLKKFVH
jgi:hypothetical protein